MVAAPCRRHRQQLDGTENESSAVIRLFYVLIGVVVTRIHTVAKTSNSAVKSCAF